jgi:hypothetical protein
MSTSPIVGDPHVSVAVVDVVANGSVSLSGVVSDAGDQIVYQFTAKARGRMYIEMDADSEGMDPYLQLLNSSQRRVARNNNARRGTLDSRIRRYVRPGQTYYILASGNDESAGDYTLRITSDPVDDYGNSAAEARALRLRRTGAGYARGRINYAGDEDYRSFVAAKTGLMTFNLFTRGRRNELVPTLSIFDADNNLVATQQADQEGLLTLGFSAVEGQTYYMKVAGADESTGSYYVRIARTLEQDLVDASSLAVPSVGEVGVAGSLAAGGSQAYSFTASADGVCSVNMKAAEGSQIDSYLELFDATGRRRRRHDNVRGSSDSRIRFRVRAGRTYYVRASAADGTEGNYELTVESKPRDDVGNDIDHARLLRLRSSGAARALRTVNYADDVDVLKVVATVTGEMQVSMAAWGRRSDVTGTLAAADAEGGELARDEAGNATALITFDVVKGEAYFLSAASFDGNTGRYSLTVLTTPEVVPDPEPAPDPDPDPDPDPQPAPDPDPDPEPDPDPDPQPENDPVPGATIRGDVVTEGGTTRLVIVGTNNNDVITLSYGALATTLTSSSGTQNFLGEFTSIYIYGFGGNDVIRTDYSITGSAVIYAGDGDDTVYENARGAATVYGGLGNDLLISIGGGQDVLRGEGGTDSFWADLTDTLADADSAEYNAMAVHRVADFYQPYSSSPSSPDYVSKEISGQNFQDPALNVYGNSWGNFASSPLFLDGPEYNDIRQGAVGDCYYLAALSSLADTDPNILRQMVTSLGDGTYAVRFFRNSQEVYLRLDADLPISYGSNMTYAKLTPDGETWVALLEKAYAHFRYGQNSYDSISGGWMSTVYREITNQTTTTRWSGGSAASLATFIAEALSNGNAATLGSYSNSPSPIVGSHAYMIKSIEGSGADAMVTVYNPWGSDGRTYDDNYYDGLLTINMTQLQECFSAVVTSAA